GDAELGRDQFKPGIVAIWRKVETAGKHALPATGYPVMLAGERRRQGVVLWRLSPRSRRSAPRLLHVEPDVEEGHQDKVKCVQGRRAQRKPAITIRRKSALDLNADLASLVPW